MGEAAVRKVDQTQRYRAFYARGARLRWLFRFDVRYRCRRMKEVIGRLGLDVDDKRVLDVGFGTGHMLRCFPPSCRLHGAEISTSAVERANADPRYETWAAAEFTLVDDDPARLPDGPFDVIVSSHTIEHVPDDRAFLRELRRRLLPGGVLLLFLPIEEPHYNPDHVRNYSLRGIDALVASAGFEVLRCEGSMHINGHVWKLITIPSRRRWPVLGPMVDALRLATLSAIPYRGVRALDRALDRIGLGPRQAFVVARRTVTEQPEG